MVFSGRKNSLLQLLNQEIAIFQAIADVKQKLIIIPHYLMQVRSAESTCLETVFADLDQGLLSGCGVRIIPRVTNKERDNS